MKKRSTFVLIVLVIILFVGSVLGYLWHTNQGFFQGNSVAGVPDGHIRSLDDADGIHYRTSFNHFGIRVHVYLAYYQRDNLILNELIAGIEREEKCDLNGFIVWNMRWAGNLSGMLPSITTSGGNSQNDFDFSKLDFEIATSKSPFIANDRIELGRRYVLQMWQSGNTFWGDNDFFNLEGLKTSEHTAILYLVFE